MRRNLLISLLVTSSVVEGAPGLQREGDVTVLAHGPAGLLIEGKSTAVSLEDEPSALLFKVPLAPIDTGIGLRNRHLRESLEVDKFPDATLRVIRSDLKFPKEGSPGLVAIGHARLPDRAALVPGRGGLARCGSRHQPDGRWLMKLASVGAQGRKTSRPSLTNSCSASSLRRTSSTWVAGFGTGTSGTRSTEGWSTTGCCRCAWTSLPRFGAPGGATRVRQPLERSVHSARLGHAQCGRGELDLG